MKYSKSVRYLSLFVILFLMMFTKRATVGAKEDLPESDDFQKTNVYQLSGPELIAFNGKNLYVALGLEQSKTSKDGENWTSHPIDLSKLDGSNVTLNDMTYGNSYFIAVGKGKHIMFSSKDGITWKAVKLYKETDAPSDSEIVKILWNGTEFSAIEKTSTSKFVIWKSKDGVKWTSKQAKGIEKEYTIYSEKFYEGNYYIVGGNYYQYGSILKSKDGITWKQLKKVNEYELKDIAYNGETYLAISHNGYELYSKDLKSWGEKKNAFGSYFSTSRLLVMDGSFYAITSSNTDRFDGNSLYVYKSKDGLNWNELSEPSFTSDNQNNTISHFKSINCFNNTLYATDNSNNILTSKDGEKWVRRDKGIDGYHFIISNLSYVGGKYFATINSSLCLEPESPRIGNKANPYILLESKDGISWEKITNPVFGYMNEVYWDGTSYYSYGEDFYGFRQNYIYKSMDGYTWTSYQYAFLDHPIDFNSTEEFYTVDKVRYINNQYFLMLHYTDDNNYVHGLIYSSEDGISWSYENEIPGHVLEDISFGNNKYVIIANDVENSSLTGSTVYTSTSLEDITLSYTNNAVLFYNSMIFDGKKFCFTCISDDDHTYLVTSSDGKKWSKVKVSDCAATYQNGLASDGSYYAVANQYLSFSADGVNWTTYDSLCKGFTASVLWDGKKWIVAGKDSIYTYNP